MEIVKIEAREILDSRGNPTVSAICELADGSIGEASVPSGASTGSKEAVELRDGGDRYGGLGGLLATQNVNQKISPAVSGRKFQDQRQFDSFLIELDGTPTKSKLGENAILAASISYAKARAISEEKELFEYLAENYPLFDGGYRLPTPMFNILNGGKHAGNNIDIQETMIVPIGIKSFREKLRAGSEIYHALRKILANEGLEVGLGDEGGFAPDLEKNEAVFTWAQKAILAAGYDLKKIRLATDVAANSFWDPRKENYTLNSDNVRLKSEKMIEKIINWSESYNLFSVEDGLSEDDPWWGKLTRQLNGRISIGDDLFVTDPKRIKAGAAKKLANGVIIKPNQIGTVSEALEAVWEARQAKMTVVVSHRSGETEDSFIADLAVAVSADFIKSGAPARSERLAKYNRLSRIEEILEQAK